VDKLLAVELALWGALLTIDALLISVSAILVTIIDDLGKYVIILAIAMAFVSSLLLYLNFDHRRALFRTLVSIPPREAILDESVWEKYFQDLQHKNQEHSAQEHRNRAYERWAIRLLFGAALLSFGTVYLHFLR